MPLSRRASFRRPHETKKLVPGTRTPDPNGTEPPGARALVLLTLVVLVLAIPASALAQSPWENAATVLQQAFTSTIARAFSLIAIVVGGRVISAPLIREPILEGISQIGGSLADGLLDARRVLQAMLEGSWRSHMIHGAPVCLKDQAVTLQIPQIAPDGVLADFETTRQAADFHSLVGLEKFQDLDLPFLPKQVHFAGSHGRHVEGRPARSAHLK